MRAATSLLFVRNGSDELDRLESLLTARQRRCNMMMVKSAEQAEAMLRRECDSGTPDLILIWGGATDERATKFVKILRADASLAKTAMIVLADDASIGDAARESGTDVGALDLTDVERRLADESFWWVVVRFGQ